MSGPRTPRREHREHPASREAAGTRRAREVPGAGRAAARSAGGWQRGRGGHGEPGAVGVAQYGLVLALLQDPAAVPLRGPCAPRHIGHQEGDLPVRPYRGVGGRVRLPDSMRATTRPRLRSSTSSASYSTSQLPGRSEAQSRTPP